MQCDGSQFSDAFGDVVSHGENLVGMFVEQQVVITEMWAAHVPVEILGFHVQCENIRQHGVQCLLDFGDAFRREVGSGVQAGNRI